MLRPLDIKEQAIAVERMTYALAYYCSKFGPIDVKWEEYNTVVQAYASKMTTSQNNLIQLTNTTPEGLTFGIKDTGIPVQKLTFYEEEVNE